MILIFSSFIAASVLLISATPEIISFEIDSILQNLNNSRQCERAFIFGNAAVFYNSIKKRLTSFEKPSHGNTFSTTMVGALYSSNIANIVLNAVLCFFAITLNGATIYALRKTPSVPKPLKALLLSLAVSDLDVGILGHPLYITRLALELQADLTSFPTFYTVYITVSSQFAYASFFGVLSLSLDRFLAIHLHLRYQELVTYQRVVTAVISVWVLSGLIPLIWPQIPIHIAYVLIAIVVVSCFVVSGVLNSKIYATVRRHAHQIHSLQVQPTVQENAPNVTSASRLRKSAFMTIHVYVLFLVCYLPNICVLGFISVYPSLAAKADHQYTSTLVLLNSSLNPLIYCWKLRGVRQTIMNTLLHAISSQN
ncbi:melanocyte-stimulating hormone receptor-like [Montipora capricornis]|uniref:melanocyte-stimulating hormone receptor-like n=1 Tax=Montipora capricornis TaxID=246305 RepID=UPI0035F16870